MSGTKLRWLSFVCGVAIVSSYPESGTRPRRDTASLWCPDAFIKDESSWEPALRRIMTDGRKAWGDSGVPDNTPPPWLDRNKMEAGKAFVFRYPLAITYAHIHALYMLLAIPSVLDVLVFTGNSDTPDEAFIRYFDTMKGVLSWYQSDFYMPGTWGHEQMKYVRDLHNLVRRNMNEGDQEVVRNKTRLPGVFTGCPVSTAMQRQLNEHVKRSCPFSKLSKRSPDMDNTVNGESDTNVYMSQYDMAATQWAFVGPVIQFPEKYGIPNATKEELEGFAHLWEVIGYSLGIEDRYNFCQGGLEPTLVRCREYLSAVVLPTLREARPPWEYMTRCMSDGLGYLVPGVSFKTQLVNMLRLTLDAPVSDLEKQLTPEQRQSTLGYNNIMNTLVKDRRGNMLNPISVLANEFLKNFRKVPKEQVKKVRSRPPHRSKNCLPIFDGSN